MNGHIYNIVYKEIYETYNITPIQTGIYIFCFSILNMKLMGII